MFSPGVGALVGVLVSVHATSAQDAIGAWIWNVTTDDGDSIVEPGETASIVLSLNFDPSVGFKGLTGEIVQGLGRARFDTLGLMNAANGQIVGWHVENELEELTGDLTTTDGVSLFGTHAEQGLLQIFSDDDPIDVLTIEWTTDDFGVYEVTYVTSMLEPLLVWEGPVGDGGDMIEWRHIEAEVVFQVVPAPAAILVVGVLAAIRARRS